MQLAAYIGFLVPIAGLYLGSKLMEQTKLRFYSVALMYVLIVTGCELAAAIVLPQFIGASTGIAQQSGSIEGVAVVQAVVIRFVVVAGIFYLLKRYEDTMAPWLITLIVGSLVLMYLVP